MLQQRHRLGTGMARGHTGSQPASERPEASIQAARTFVQPSGDTSKSSSSSCWKGDGAGWGCCSTHPTQRARWGMQPCPCCCCACGAYLLLCRRLESYSCACPAVHTGPVRQAVTILARDAGASSLPADSSRAGSGPAGLQGSRGHLSSWPAHSVMSANDMASGEWPAAGRLMHPAASNVHSMHCIVLERQQQGQPAGWMLSKQVSTTDHALQSACGSEQEQCCMYRDTLLRVPVRPRRSPDVPMQRPLKLCWPC